jgi:hypothetical protein
MHQRARVRSAVHSCLLSFFFARISKHTDKHIECAPAYLEYGRALLRKAQQADDPFGSKLPREDAAKEAKPAGEGGASDAGEKPGASAEGDEGFDDGVEGEEGEEDAGEEAEADDLELAFQCLEMARLIYEKVRGCSAHAPPTICAQILTTAVSLNSHLSAWRWRG